MGHEYHYLYSVDLMHPADFRASLLVEAESYSDGCNAQRQALEPVQWTQDRKTISVVVRRLEFQRFATACRGFTERPPFPASLTLQFEVTEGGLRKSKQNVEP